MAEKIADYSLIHSYFIMFIFTCCRRLMLSGHIILINKCHVFVLSIKNEEKPIFFMIVIKKMKKIIHSFYLEILH